MKIHIDKEDKTGVIELLGLQIYFGPWFIDVWSAKKVQNLDKDFIIFSIGK